MSRPPDATPHRKWWSWAWAAWTVASLFVYAPDSPWLVLVLLALFAAGEGSGLAYGGNGGGRTLSEHVWAITERGKLKHRYGWVAAFVSWQAFALLWGVFYAVLDWDGRALFASAGILCGVSGLAWWLLKHLRARRFEG